MHRGLPGMLQGEFGASPRFPRLCAIPYQRRQRPFEHAADSSCGPRQPGHRRQISRRLLERREEATRPGLMRDEPPPVRECGGPNYPVARVVLGCEAPGYSKADDAAAPRPTAASRGAMSARPWLQMTETPGPDRHTRLQRGSDRQRYPDRSCGPLATLRQAVVRLADDQLR